MTYSITWSPKAQNRLRKLDNKTIIRIVKKVKQIRHDPKPYMRRLSGEKFYRLRIGHCRVIIKVITENKEIRILSLGHRKNIYKEM